MVAMAVAMEKHRTAVVRELGVPAQFSQISCQILAEKFFQSNKNFPTIFFSTPTKFPNPLAHFLIFYQI